MHGISRETLLFLRVRNLYNFWHLPAVTNHNLGRVFVGHHDSRAWQSGSMRSGVVLFKRFLGHSGVQVVSDFEGIPTNRHQINTSGYGLGRRPFLFKLTY
jgi:hypothetical protein